MHACRSTLEDPTVAAGFDPVLIQRGIARATTEVIRRLRELSRPVRDRKLIEGVAFLASNRDEELARLLADASEKVGAEGLIAVEEGKTSRSRLEVAVGLEIEKGWLSANFANPPGSKETVLENPLVLVYDDTIETAEEAVALLEKAQARKRPLFICAHEIKHEALKTLVRNSVDGVVRVAAVPCPELYQMRQDILEDVGAFTGAFVFSRGMGIKPASIRLEDFGGAERVTVDHLNALIVGGKGKKDRLEERRQKVRKALADPRLEPHEREKMENRLAKLTGGVAVYYAGGQTEIDMKDRAKRAENAACAIRAARAEGVLPGGGVALVKAAAVLDDLELPEDERPAIRIMRRALEAPARTIARNAGAPEAVVIQRIRDGKGGFGYNAHTERFEDLFEAGVVDPTKVVRLALQCASSVAGLLLSIGAVVAVSPSQPAEKTELDPPIPNRYK